MTDNTRAVVHAWLTIAFESRTPPLRHLYASRALRACTDPNHEPRIREALRLTYDDAAFRTAAHDARRWLAIELAIDAHDHGPGAGIFFQRMVTT